MRASLDLPAVPPEADDRFRLRDVMVLAGCAAVLLATLLVDPLHGVAAHFENRSLADWPSGRPGADWFARIDAAVSDRYRGRNALIALQHAIVVDALGSSPVPNVLLGRDGWLFFRGEDGHALDVHVRGTRPFPDAQVDALAVELERRRRFLAGQGIGYVVAIVPDKSTIYAEHLPAWMKRMSGPTPLERAMARLALYPDLRVVDLATPLKAGKATEQVYYRTDSHWNYLGATIAYHAIMNAVREAVGPDKLPSIAPVERPPYVPGVDVYRGDLARMVGARTRYAEDDLAPLGKVLAGGAKRCGRRIDDGRDAGFETYVCDRAPPLRGVMLRDSMAIPLIPMMSENFRRIVYVSARRLDPALVAREHPDVVIEELVERSLNAPAAFPIPGPPLATAAAAGPARP